MEKAAYKRAESSAKKSFIASFMKMVKVWEWAHKTNELWIVCGDETKSANK